MIPSNSVQLVFVGGCFRMFVVAVVGTYLVDLGYSNEALPVLLEISSTNYVSFKSFNVLLLLHISPPSATDRHLYPEPCESILPTNHFARIMEVLGAGPKCGSALFALVRARRTATVCSRGIPLRPTAVSEVMRRRERRNTGSPAASASSNFRERSAADDGGSTRSSA